jgi:hypothetical protein
MCRRFKLSEAKHRSGIIAEQIQRKLLEQKEKAELPRLRTNPTLLRLTDKRNKLAEEVKRIDKELETNLHKLGLKDETWYDENDVRKKRWGLDPNICLIPDKTLNELQRATDLHALGKAADAQKIWTKVIQDFKLGTE